MIQCASMRGGAAASRSVRIAGLSCALVRDRFVTAIPPKASNHATTKRMPQSPIIGMFVVKRNFTTLTFPREPVICSGVQLTVPLAFMFAVLQWPRRVEVTFLACHDQRRIAVLIPVAILYFLRARRR